MSERNEAVVRRVFEEVLNQGRLDLIDELYDPHILDHDPLPGAPEGIDGVRYSIGGLLEAFPDLHVTIEDMAAHGNLVTVHNTWTGTQTGRLVGLPATGRALTFSGVVIWRLDDGKIVERWAVIDLAEKLGIATRRRGRRIAGALELGSAVTSFVSLQPIPPERFDEWMAFHDELKGPRRHEYDESRRRLGVRREALWLVIWPRTGDMRYEIGYYEVEDIVRFGQGLATSDEPFDKWFRERVAYFHGFDWSAVTEIGPSSELMFEWTAD